MSSSLSFRFPKTLPPLSTPQSRGYCQSLLSQQKQPHNSKPDKKVENLSLKTIDCFSTLKKSSLGIQFATIMTTAAQPAFAVTGVNNEEDIVWVLIQLGISAFFYFLVAPPIIMNWLRKRWYRRKFFEMYLQFMFVFMFFPGLLLWAPLLNFRKFPRDPDMKYPWEKPEDPSKINSTKLKYPWGTVEDYD